MSSNSPYRKSASRPSQGVRRFLPVAVALAFGLIAPAALGQPIFSIDYQGPPKGIPDGWWGFPITEGDLLLPFPGIPAFGPLPNPGIYISGGFGPPAPGLGLPMHPGAVGLPAGTPGRVEVDALSFGKDLRLLLDSDVRPPIWSFSVDEWAVGIPGTPLPPCVWSEGANANREAAADIFIDLAIGLGPFGPGPVIGDMELLDGNGIPPPGLMGLGLIEPDPPVPGPRDPGSNLDALDIDTRVLPDTGVPFVAVYYSLDAANVFDPLEGVAGSGSAAANGGFRGGDVLVTRVAGGPPMLFAPAAMLGLDFLGADTDDLDALILWDNGNGVYDPPRGPYSWANGATDMLFFSIRRGSSSIGRLDFLWNRPIEPGDILMPPPPGPVGTPPGIWTPAEMLGLATVRSGMANFGDDLDAADLSPDCNGNRSPDGLDIATGTSKDCNNNGIPDECEPKNPACDTNCDGTVNLFDIQPFMDLLAGLIPPCSPCAGDTNGDGTINLFDIQPFVDCL